MPSVSTGAGKFGGRKCLGGCLLVCGLLAVLIMQMMMKVRPNMLPEFEAKHVTLNSKKGSDRMTLHVDLERKEPAGAWHSLDIHEGECKITMPCHKGDEQHRCALLRAKMPRIEFDEDGEGQATVFLGERDPVGFWDVVRKTKPNLTVSCTVEAQIDLFKLGLGLGPKRTLSWEFQEQASEWPKVRFEKQHFKASHGNMTVFTEGSYNLLVSFSDYSESMANFLTKVPFTVQADFGCVDEEHETVQGQLSVRSDVNVTLNAARDESADEILLKLPFEFSGRAHGPNLLGRLVRSHALEGVKVKHTKSMVSESARRLALPDDVEPTLAEDLASAFEEAGSDEMEVDIFGWSAAYISYESSYGHLTSSGSLDEEAGLPFQYYSEICVADCWAGNNIYADVYMFDEPVLTIWLQLDADVLSSDVDSIRLELDSDGYCSNYVDACITGSLYFEDNMTGDAMGFSVVSTDWYDPWELQVTMTGANDTLEMAVETENLDNFTVNIIFYNGTDSSSMWSVVTAAPEVFEDAGLDDTDGFTFNIEAGESTSLSFRLLGDSELVVDLTSVPVDTGFDLAFGMTEGASANSILTMDSSFRDDDGNLSLTAEIEGLVSLLVESSLKQFPEGFDFSFETSLGDENESGYELLVGASANFRTADGDTTLVLGLEGLADVEWFFSESELDGGYDWKTALVADGVEEFNLNVTLLEIRGNESWRVRFRSSNSSEEGFGVDLVYTIDPAASDNVFRTEVAFWESSDFSDDPLRVAFRASTLDVFEMTQFEDGRNYPEMTQPYEIFLGVVFPGDEEAIGFFFQIAEVEDLVSVTVQVLINGVVGLGWRTTFDFSLGTSMLMASDMRYAEPDSRCVNFEKALTMQDFSCGEEMMTMESFMANGGTDYNSGLMSMNGVNDSLDEDLYMNVSRGFLEDSWDGYEHAMWFSVGAVEDNGTTLTNFAIVRGEDGEWWRLEMLEDTEMDGDEEVVVGENIITGLIMIAVENKEEFCANEDALQAFANVLMTLTGGSADVACADDRRLFGAMKQGGSRRLAEDVTLEYSITTEGSVSTAAALETLRTLDPETMEYILQQEFDKLGLDIEVSVQSLSAPSVGEEEDEEEEASTSSEPETTLLNSNNPEDEEQDGSSNRSPSKILPALVAAIVAGASAAMARL